MGRPGPLACLIAGVAPLWRSRRHRGDPHVSPTAPRQPLPEHIDQNIENVVAITKREWEQLGHWQRRVEHIGRFVSRPVYIVGLLSFAGAWVAVNVAASLYGRKPFDPF